MLLLNAHLLCFYLKVEHFQVLHELCPLRFGEGGVLGPGVNGARFSRMAWMNPR